MNDLIGFAFMAFILVLWAREWWVCREENVTRLWREGKTLW